MSLLDKLDLDVTVILHGLSESELPGSLAFVREKLAFVREKMQAIGLWG